MSSIGLLRMIAQMAVIPILARHVDPHDYGIMAIAMPFVLFAMIFSDAGISSSLIRTDKKNDSEWSTSFWFVVLVGSLLSLLITLLGFGLSIFMSQDILFPVIACLSLSVLLQSFATVSGAALQQENKYTTISCIEIMAVMISLVSTLYAAINGWGVWSLVIQQVIYFTIKLVLTNILSPFRPQLIFKIKEIADHLKFGRDMLGSNFINFCRLSLTNTLMGRVLGTSPLGIFSMASLFSDLPYRIISGPLQTVLYPRMARLKDHKISIRSLYLFVSKILSILIVPSFGMIAIAHEPVFTIILSEKWQQAGHIFLLLAPATILQSVTALRGTIMMALGQTQLILRQTFQFAAISLILFIIFIWFGIEWTAIAVTLTTLITLPYFLYQTFSLIDLGFKDYIRSIITPVILTLIMVAIYIYIDHLDISQWEKFASAVGLGCTALFLSIALQFKRLQTEIENLRQILNTPLTDPS